MNILPRPNNKVIKTYLSKWSKLEKYILQENSLNILFLDFCPKNVAIEEVLLKVSALNDFYSTNIFDTYSVARHILKCEIDASMKNGDPNIVDKIAPVAINGKTRRFYSFASKYCNHHQPLLYPIYDSYVEKMLMYFKKKDKFDVFTKPQLKSYPKFIKIINQFKKFYELDEFSLREIDIYLWLAGKEYFPNKYDPRKKLS